jgi:hypothetical protein
VGVSPLSYPADFLVVDRDCCPIALRRPTRSVGSKRNEYLGTEVLMGCRAAFPVRDYLPVGARLNASPLVPTHFGRSAGPVHFSKADMNAGDAPSGVMGGKLPCRHDCRLDPPASISAVPAVHSLNSATHCAKTAEEPFAFPDARRFGRTASGITLKPSSTDERSCCRRR